MGEIEVKREVEVFSELRILDLAIKETSAILETLEGRLAPIIRKVPEKLTTATEEAKPEKQLVPLAASIKKSRDDVNSIKYRISSLIRQLEI